jgi:hypothetical protein
MSTSQWLTALGGALIGLVAVPMGAHVHFGLTMLDGSTAYIFSMLGGAVVALSIRWGLRGGVWG